jgi:hypothetical protein
MSNHQLIPDQDVRQADFVDDRSLLLDGGTREEGRTDLLCDTTRLALLYRRLSNLK